MDNKSHSIKQFFSPLKEIHTFLTRQNIKHVIIGGIAASLLGRARFTADIDILALIPAEVLFHIIEKAEQSGFSTRISDAIDFAKKNNVILLNHDQTKINIDISLGLLPFEKEVFDRSKLFKSGEIEFHLPTPEDLIIMKAVAHRPIDLKDIQSIYESNPNIEIKRIKYWVKEFSKILEIPEIIDDLASILPL